MKNINCIQVLKTKLDKDTVKKSYLPKSKDVIHLKFIDGEFRDFKKNKKDISKIFFKGVDVKFYYTLEDGDNLYKSNVIDKLDDNEKLIFSSFRNRELKLKFNDSNNINLKNGEVIKKFKFNYKVLLFLQGNDDKLYIIDCSKTNYSLLYTFYNINNDDYSIEFSLGNKSYSDNGFDFWVIDYILKDGKEIESKDFSNKIENYIKHF